jgi:ParB/RepB/Spo0J family partition protein
MDISGRGSVAVAGRLVSPTKCRIWTLHARSEDSINSVSCASLIRSMQKHGQRLPALARHRVSADGAEFELIYGARRLFAAQHLGIDLLIEVRDMGDRAAVIEMDIENRPREDISPYDRGLNYSRWLRAGYFRNQVELAKELCVSEARVSRLLKYAELPAVVVAAFHSVRDIREEWAVRLANTCRDPKFRGDVMRRARERAAMTRRGSAQCMYDALLRGTGIDRVKEQTHDEVIRSANGKPLFRIAFRPKTLHVILPRADLAAEALDEITRSIAGVLEQSGASARVPVETRHSGRLVERAARASLLTSRAGSPRRGRSQEVAIDMEGDAGCLLV